MFFLSDIVPAAACENISMTATAGEMPSLKSSGGTADGHLLLGLVNAAGLWFCCVRVVCDSAGRSCLWCGCVAARGRFDEWSSCLGLSERLSTSWSSSSAGKCCQTARTRVRTSGRVSRLLLLLPPPPRLTGWHPSGCDRGHKNQLLRSNYFFKSPSKYSG